MKKQYTVTASLPGCMPDSSNRYGTKETAVWGMTYELENWAEAWKYQYDPEKKEEVKNPYWRVLGSAKSGFYQVQLGKFHFINICMHVDVVYAEDEED